MKAYRFKCRPRGRSYWTGYPLLTAYHTRQTAARRITLWEHAERDRCIEWACEECLPGDIDHPGRRD